MKQLNGALAEVGQCARIVKLVNSSNCKLLKDNMPSQKVRPSEIDFEVYDEDDKESRRSNRFDDSHESQQMQSNVIARDVGQIRSSPYNDFRSRKSKLSDDNEEEMKRNNFNGFRSQRENLSPDGTRQIKRINVDDIRLQRDTRNPNCKGEVNVPSRDCAARLTKDGGGHTKRIQLNGFRIQREEINPNCNGTEKVPSRNCTPRLTKDGGGQTKRNQLNGFRIQRNEINSKCKGEPGVPNDENCDGLLKRINVDGIRIQRDTANPNCKGEEGKLNKRVCNLQMKRTNGNGIRIQRENPNCTGQVGKLDKKGCNLKVNRIDMDGIIVKRGESKCKGVSGELSDTCEGRIKRNQFDGFRRSLSNLNPAEKRAVQIRKRKNFSKIPRNRQNFGDLGTAQTEGRQVDRRLLPIQSGNFDYLDVEHDIQSRESDSDQAELQAIDYNSDEQLTNREDIDGEESRQIHDDRSQHLQPETDEGSPTLARRSNPLSDLDDDHGIDQEKILQVDYDAVNYKVSNTAEETSHTDDLLALLVRLVRDKRRQTDPLES